MNYPDGMQFEHISGDGDQYAENRRRMAEEGVRDDFKHAIAFAASVEALAVIADAYAATEKSPRIPSQELYSHGVPDTWANVAEELRGIIHSTLAATDKQLDELADVRITGEGYA